MATTNTASAHELPEHESYPYTPSDPNLLENFTRKKERLGSFATKRNGTITYIGQLAAVIKDESGEDHYFDLDQQEIIRPAQTSQ